MAALVGRAVVPNANGISLTGAITSATTKGLNQRFEGDHSGDSTYTRDSVGDIVTGYYHGGMHRVRLTVVPVADAATLASAQAALLAWTNLARGAIITIVDADQTAGIWEGAYCLVSCRESRGNTDPATVDLEIETNAAHTLAVATS